MIARYFSAVVISGVAILLPAMGARANDCNCPTVQAFGKGSTSCSASESNGRCMIDYNLFSRESEARATQILREAGVASARQPTPGLPIQTLLDVGLRDSDALVDLVLVYLLVAAADQAMEFSINMNDQAGEVVHLITPYRASVQNAFGPDQTRQWMQVPDSRLRDEPVTPPLAFADNKVIVAPGCIEAQVSQLWVMFKASWSPMRIRSNCGR